MKQGLKNLAPFPSSKLDQKEDRSKVTVQSTSAGIEEDEEAISPQVYRVCSMASEGSEVNGFLLMRYFRCTHLNLSDAGCRSVGKESFIATEH